MDFVEDRKDLGGLKAMADQITLGLTINCLHYPTPNPMTNLEIKYKFTVASYQNESCLACPHPPSRYEGGREQVGSSHFDKKILILIGHYGIFY